MSRTSRFANDPCPLHCGGLISCSWCHGTGTFWITTITETMRKELDAVILFVVETGVEWTAARIQRNGEFAPPWWFDRLPRRRKWGAVKDSLERLADAGILRRGYTEGERGRNATAYRVATQTIHIKVGTGCLYRYELISGTAAIGNRVLVRPEEVGSRSFEVFIDGNIQGMPNHWKGYLP